MTDVLDRLDVGDTTPDLVLRFSHNIIEHLGLKLYQNRPTNVVAELVSNAWDAGSQKVWIDTHTSSAQGEARYVSVIDNGEGMSVQALADAYLVIGLAKDRSRYAQSDRYPMGRKGIGKLAPFGIAGLVDICTVARAADGAPKATWLRLHADRIMRDSVEGGPTEMKAYRPEQVCVDAAPADVPVALDPTGSVKKLLDHIASSTGTMILLRDLSLNRELNAAAIRRSMGRRFTVTLTRPDFKVNVDSVEVSEADALPEFEFRIPETGTRREDIGNGRFVDYWVGFVKSADWPQDEAGVGVYAHGKIAQDRPHFFGARGGELYSRYMYGVVTADWLDELDEDIVSTDRRSLDWDNPEASELRTWGASRVRSWITQYENWRKLQAKKKVRERVDLKITGQEMPQIASQERDIISEMLAEVAPGLGKDDAALDQVTGAVLKAYLHRPMREVLKRVWDRLSTTGVQDQAAAFLATVDELSLRSVPESMSLAVTFAQRAYALGLLDDLVHKGKEPDLQRLIEQFPWIIDPAYEKLTANQRLTTVVREAAAQGLIHTRMPTGGVEVNDEYKPDFVFLADYDRTEIIVVEIKSPQVELTIENREQLHAYLVYLEQHYPSSKRTGILIGTRPDRVSVPAGMLAFSWKDIFVRSRRGHVELLAAMLKNSIPDGNDDRVSQIREFGGEATWALLKTLAADDEDLQALFASLPKIVS